MQNRSYRSRRLALTEAQVNIIIRDEALSMMMLNEGTWDDVKQGALKLRKAVSQKFGDSIKKFVEPLKKITEVVQSSQSDLNTFMSALKKAMQESGESIHMDQGLKTAQELGKLGVDGQLGIVQSDLEGPVHDMAEKLQEKGTKAESKYMASLYGVLLSEGIVIESSEIGKIKLTEALGVTTGLGLILGAFGGMHLLFKGLSKVASFMKMTGTSELFTKWATALHHFEQATLDKVVPDKLAYYFYKLTRNSIQKMFPYIQLGRKEAYEFDEFVKDTTLKMQIKTSMYKVLLIILLGKGIGGAVKAGFSVLGVAEGLASVVKGIEVATGVAELIAIAGTARAVT